MNSRLMIGLLITAVLVISASGQDNSNAKPTDNVMASLPRQQSSSTALPQAQVQTPTGSRDAGEYLVQMDGVLQMLSEDLGRIAQASHDGKITRAQAEYLSVERYYIGLMRLQLLRTLFQNPEDSNQSETYTQANTAPQVSGSMLLAPPPTSSPDVSQKIAGYLELNPAQIADIQTQIADDRKQVQPLLEQLDKNRRKLTLATLEGRFDTEEVQALAAEQSRILEQLIMANALLEAKVYKVLNSDQQRKVDELRRQKLASLKASFPDW